MKKITLSPTSNKSEILVGEKIENLARYLPDKKMAIITDTNVAKLYRDKFPPGIEVIEIQPGENHKTLETVEWIASRLVDIEMDRGGFILGIGGGIVCDVAGFVASVYMRGLPFGFVSTTLLSQVDASIGGKNGVNLKGYKNMIGVFNQPRFVICDLDMLGSLQEDDFLTGFAEIVKHACIRDKDMFAFIEKNIDKAKAKDKETILKLVYESLLIKKAVVEKDEREGGLRRILNFGHTYGHAIEKISGLTHGQAISIGMAIACNLSVGRGLLSEKEAGQVTALLKKFGLPVSSGIEQTEIFEVLKKDKKREGNQIHFVLLDGIGDTIIEKVDLKELEDIVL